MKQYQELIKHVMDNGKRKEDRTGTGTISTFGYQTRYDLQEGFPLVTTKKTFVRGIFEELFWFLDGDTDVSTLIDKNVHIWTPDAHRWYKQKGGELDKEAFIKHAENAGFDLGPIYGHQWRSWTDKDGQTVDQIMNLIEEIKTNPDSRRLIVSAWNPGDLPAMALPPCHCLFQFYVQDGKLSCQLYQRSADSFLGVPFNIASYALLTHMIAHVTGLEVGEFIHTFGDMHLYTNHLEQAEELLSREPRPLPKLVIKRDVKDINDFKFEDFEIVGYDPHPSIKADVSVG